MNLEEVIPVKSGCSRSKFNSRKSKRSNSFKGSQFSLVSKYFKKIIYVDITRYYYPSKLPVTTKCEDVDHAFGEGFCLSRYI